MAKPRKLPNGKWRVQIRRAGRTYDQTFDTRKDATIWAKSRIDEVREAKKNATRSGRDRNLREALDRYETDHSDANAKQSSHRLWWRDEIGHLTLGELNAAHIADALHKKQSGGCGPATCNRYQSAISVALTYCSTPRVGWLEDNPARKVPRLKEPKGRTTWLRDDERTKLLDACRSSDWSGLYTLVLLALSTGARVGELMALTWRNVDLMKGTVYFEKTKNSDPRLVPLAAIAHETLHEWAKVRRMDTDLVFPSWEIPSKPFEFRKHWDSARAAAELTDLRFHDLRHSAGSYLAQAGLSVRQIASLLGHRTLAMAMRYSHLSDEHHEDIRSVMGDRLG